MLLIYADNVNSRIKYVFNLIFKEVLGIEYKLSKNAEEFNACKTAKLNYSNHCLEDEIFIQTHSLMKEKGIQDQVITVFSWEELPVFFSTSKKSLYPFDPFAVSFYLVTRYEEYLPHLKDRFNRFKAEESIAFINNFHHKPLVNILALKIKDEIANRYPSFKFPEKRYTFTPTIDIDIAFADLDKGLVRTVAGYLKLISQGKFHEIVLRTQTLLGIREDDYNNFDFQMEILKRYKLKAIYFVLLSDYGELDKNIPFTSSRFTSLIKALADYYEVGIHPSYQSNKDFPMLKVEIERLREILHKEITKSRQHFLSLTMPGTYRRLIDHDITDDYTMGYASQAGFRASICTAYHFYDLDLEVETDLKLHPFAFMDSCLMDYLKLKPDEMVEYVKPIIEEVKQVNGDLIAIWHNYALSNIQEWEGYKAKFEEIISLAVL